VTDAGPRTIEAIVNPLGHHWLRPNDIGEKLHTTAYAAPWRKMPTRAAGAVTTAFPARPWRRRITNTSTQKSQQRTSSPMAMYVSKSNNIRERFPQFVEPRMAKYENGGGHCAQFPQRVQIGRATLEQRGAIRANQDEHGVLRQNLQRR